MKKDNSKGPDNLKNKKLKVEDEKNDKEGQNGENGDDEYKPELFKSLKQKEKEEGKVNLKLTDIGLADGEIPEEETNIRTPAGFSAHSNPNNSPLKGMKQPEPSTKSILEPLLDEGKKNHFANQDILDNEELDDMINPILFVRGVKNECFYLILSGKVMVCSGNEGFLLEQGAFNFMGVECLGNDHYVPDFSAKIIGKTKLLKITREDYRKCLTHIKNNPRSLV
jgi:hypothetical protein